MRTNQSKTQGKVKQVWVQLSRERQIVVIQLMAQLALKWVVAQVENSQKEA